MHAREVENPKETYPKTLIIAGCIIIFSLTFSSLGLCMIIDPEILHTELQQAVIKSFKVFFEKINFSAGYYMIGISMILGCLGVASSWILGLVRGLDVALADANLFPFLQVKNKNNIPYRILIVQGLIYLILMAFYLFLPDGTNASYSLLSILTAQFSLLYYIFLFLAFIKLKGDVSFRHKILPIIGIVTCVVGISVGYFPDTKNYPNVAVYEIELIIGEIIFLSPILCLLFIKKRDDYEKTPGDIEKAGSNFLPMHTKKNSQIANNILDWEQNE